MTTVPTPIRTKPPETRVAVSRKFNIEGYDVHLTIGFYDNGSPCEVFIGTVATGCTIERLFDQVGRLISALLQYGVPLEELVELFVSGGREDLTFCPSVPGPNKITEQILILLLKETEKRKSDIAADCG